MGSISALLAPLVLVLYLNTNLGWAQDLEYHIQRQPNDEPSAAGFYTSTKRFQFKLKSNATQIQLQLLSSKSGNPGRYNYRLVLGADNGTTYNELFKYNSIGTPILPLVGQRSEVGRFNAETSVLYVVDWSGRFSVTADGVDVFPNTNLHEEEFTYLDYVNIDLGKYGETDETDAYSEWCIQKTEGSSFWVKPSMIGEYRDRVDVDPDSGSFEFFLRACVGARVAMFFDNSEDVTYEIVFGNKEDANPIVYVLNSAGQNIMQGKRMATSCFDFRSFTLTWETLGARLQTIISTGPDILFSGLPFNDKKLTRLGFSRGPGSLNGADFFFGKIGDLRGEFMTDVSVQPDGYTGVDDYITYVYPIISYTRAVAITDSHDHFLTFGLYTAKEIQIEISNFAQKLVFTLGQGYGSTKINDQPEQNKTMSQLFKPGQITQFQLQFDLDTVIALVPVDGTDPNDPMATSDIFGLAGNPLVVTVDALGDPDAVIVVDQMPVHEVHFTTTPTEDPDGWVLATVYLSDHMIFRVSSTSTVTVTLCTQIEGCDWNQLYLITVAGDKVSLADAKKTEVTFTMKGPLTDDTQMTFWIRWTDGVSIGRGSDIHRNELLRLEGDQLRIWAAAFFSDGDATWSVIRSNANAVSLNPEITSKVEVHKPANSFLVSTRCSTFGIISENLPLHGESLPSETIPLTFDTSMSNPYLHGRCDVTRGELRSASLSLKHPEGSIDLRRYWVSWADEDMFVGQGFPMGLTALLAPEPPGGGNEIIDKVALNVEEDKTCAADWVLPPNGGGKSLVMEMHTPVDVAASIENFNWLAVTEETSKVFAVTSCAPVQVVTTVFRGLLDEKNHLVTFGENLPGAGGLAVTLRQGFDLSKIGDSYVMETFDCTKPRYYWVSWNDGEIQAGFGQHVGSNGKVKMALVEGGEKIGALGYRLSGTDDISGSWAFPEEHGSRFEVMTLGDGDRRPELMVFHDTFAFRLRSCDQVTVRLSRSYNGALDDDYEFVLDPRYGNYSVLRTVHPTQAVVMADLGGRLSCTDYSDFWIAIGDGMLKLGQGEWYTTALMEASINDADNYRFVQLTSSGLAHWSFKDNAALMNRFHTPVDGRLDHVMYQKHDAESFVFSVKACTGIMIGLYGPYYGDDGYFVWLGGGSGMDRWNGISKRKDVEPEVKVTNDRWPPTVQCETAADFWVSWDNKRVAAGEGREVGINTLVEESTGDSDPLVYAAGLGMLPPVEGSTMEEAEWEISNIPDIAYVYDTTTTANLDHYVRLPPMVTSYSFRLRTCGSGIINLYPQGLRDFQYSIILGRESSITEKGGYGPDKPYTSPVTDCKRDAEFLLDWSKGKLVVKLKLTSGEWFEFLKEESELMPFRDVAMGAVGPERAYWTLWPVEGKSLFYGGTLAGPLWNMLPYEQNIVLHVKGTGKAKVTLAAVPGVTSQDTYEITLENRDPGCLLNFNGEPQNLFSFEDTNTLSSSRYFTFWMSWKQGMIEVGSGSTVGLGRFLGWRNPTPVPIRALTVNKDVFWRFDSESEPSYQVSTPTGSDNKDGPIVWLGDQKRFHFRVQAAKDARLSLAGTGTSGPVEIVMDATSNSKISVLDGAGSELASSTGQYLSEQTLNAFWIDWTDDLEMGLGYTYGYQMILNASLPGDLDIDRVQMYSPWQDKEGAYEAVWRWGSNQGLGVEYPLYYTRPLSAIKYEWRDVYDSHIVFQVLGCEDISIVLGSEKLHPEALPFSIRGINIVLNRDETLSSCDDNYEPCISLRWTVTQSCDDYQTYWLHWTTPDLYKVTLGYGGILWEDVILDKEVELAEHFAVTAIGFRNPTAEKMHFRFLNISGNAVRMVTSQDSSGIPLTVKPKPDVNNQTWNVHSCGPIKVGFWELYDTAQTKSTIRSATHLLTIDDDGYKIDSEDVEDPHPGLLGCANPRRMYAGWDQKELQAGTLSNVGKYKLTVYDEDEFGPFEAVSFASPDTDTKTVWDITQMPGDFTTLKIKGTSGFKGTYVGVSGIKRIYFKVKSGSPVSVAICEVPGITTSRAYELVIEKTKLTLKSSVDGQEVGHSDSSNLLSADAFSEYWIDWGDRVDGTRRVTIGRRDVGQDATLMTNIPFDLNAINALTAKTTQNIEMSMEFFTPTSISIPSTTVHTTPKPKPTPPITVDTTPEDSSSSSSSNTTIPNDGNHDGETGGSSGGISDGGIVGIVVAVFIVVIAGIILYAYRDRWLPLIRPRGTDTEDLVRYNAKEADGVEMASSVDPRLTFPDFESQPA